MSIINYNWESFSFPIKLTNISCEFGYHNFPSDSIIEIYRDEELDFIVKIYGKTNDPKIAEYSHPLNQNKPGEFIEGENIIGYEINTNAKFELKGFHVSNVSFSACDEPLFKLYFVIDIRIDFLTEINNGDDPDSVIEFFLTSGTDIRFPRNTYYYTPEEMKVRVDIDEDPYRDKLSGIRMAWDFFLIELEDFSFIVQEVQKDILPAWANGFIIEYRNSFGKIPAKEIRIAISEIVSFILGVEFIKIGYTELDVDKAVIKRFGNAPYGDNIIARCNKVCMRPIKYPRKHSRTEIEPILNKVIPTYIKYRKDFNLNGVLWKFWKAENSPIGINLPILSSAIEGLAESYLKYYKMIPKPDEETNKMYKQFLKDNTSFLEALKEYGFGKSVINKIENPYNYGVGEKLSLFFNSLDIILGKDSIENEALKSRNKMTHSSSSIDSNDKAKEAIRMTRAYETLFNRTILKVLNYDGKYIDYYTIGHPERNLSDNIEQLV